MKNPEKPGVRRMHPSGCLPLLGIKGVTIITRREYQRIIGKKGL